VVYIVATRLTMKTLVEQPGAPQWLLRRRDGDAGVGVLVGTAAHFSGEEPLDNDNAWAWGLLDNLHVYRYDDDDLVVK
jgi:hypothetical protein